MQTKPEYMVFYVVGRTDDSLDADDIDLDEVADQVMDGADMRQTLMDIATKVASRLHHDRDKKEWLAENEEDIIEAGGDKQLAWDHYVAGRIDELAHELEGDLIEAMSEDDDDDDEGDDEDED